MLHLDILGVFGVIYLLGFLITFLILNVHNHMHDRTPYLEISFIFISAFFPIFWYEYIKSFIDR